MPGILVVDDHLSIRFLLSTLVEKEGFLVCGEAVDGVDAIQQAKKLRPDLVLLDLAMPRLNGIETAAALRKMLPGVRLILFTLTVDGLAKALPPALGIDVVLSKEESLTKLTGHLKHLMPPTFPANQATTSLRKRNPPLHRVASASASNSKRTAS
jgi:two-component system response regulator EvgA